MDWIERVVLFSLDGVDAVAVPMPDEWQHGWADLSVLMNGRTYGTVKLVEASYISALLAHQPVQSRHSLAGSSPGQWASLLHPHSSRAPAMRRPPHLLTSQMHSAVTLLLSGAPPIDRTTSASIGPEEKENGGGGSSQEQNEQQPAGKTLLA